MKALKLLPLVAAGLIAGATTYAGNQALVDTLVKKGYLTSEEASEMSSGTGLMTSSSRHHTTGVTLDGLIHAQYDFFDVDTNGATSNVDTRRSIPSLRKIKLGLHAELTDEVTAHFAFGNSTIDTSATNSTGFMNVSHAYIQWAPMDEFHGSVGFKGAAFGHENSVSSKDHKMANRSMSARYFEEVLGFGADTVGIFAEGEFADDFYYSASIGRNDSLADNGKTKADSNRPSLAGTIGYRGTADDLHFNVGGSAGYVYGKYDRIQPGHENEFFAFALFADLNYMDFSMLTEVSMANVSKGKGPTGDLKDSSPFGITVMPSYMLNEEFELVAMYSYLDTDKTNALMSGTSRSGAYASTVLRGSVASSDAANVNLDHWHQFYLGGNYYILGNDLKLSLGYTWTQGKGKLDGSKSGANATADKTTIHGLGARLQLLF